MSRLGVNIDHVATLRQARGGREPDPVWAAVLAELGGADGITVHLREDRRHIQDRDLRLLRETVQVRLNLEMAVEPGDRGDRPGDPARPGHARARASRGADDRGRARRRRAGRPGGRSCPSDRRGGDRGLLCSSIPTPGRSRPPIAMGVAAVELHTGRYADAPEGPARDWPSWGPCGRPRPPWSPRDWSSTPATASITGTSAPIARIDRMAELNIGHSIVSRAVFVGLTQAVREMKDCICKSLHRDPSQE